MIDPINPNRLTVLPTSQVEKDDNTSLPPEKPVQAAEVLLPHHIEPKFTLTSEPACSYIVNGAIRILEEVGLVVENKEALSLLQRARAKIDGQRVFLTEALIRQALQTAPHQVIIYNRLGKPVIDLSGNNVYFTPGSAAPWILDPESCTARRPVTADLKALAQLTDTLPNYTAQSTGLVPSDVPQDIADSYRLYIALLNSPKPIVTGTFRKESFPVMHDMLSIVAGGNDKLNQKPFAIFDTCPVSPLKWGDDQAQTLIDCARAGIPAEIVPAPLAGATSPVTLMDTVIQHCAENLGGLVIHQLASPHSPVIYGGCAMNFDMRHTIPSIGAMETTLVQSSCAEVGKYLGLPTHGYMGLSDSKLVDFQAGMETAIGLILATLSGVNNIAGPGMLESINCLSLEKLVLDHEICGMAMRLRSGISVQNDPSLVLSTIRDGIEQGEFLSLPHTVKNFRKETLFPSGVIDRATRDMWQSAGGKDTWQRAKDRVQKLLTGHEPTPLSEHIVVNLTACMEQAKHSVSLKIT